MQRLFSSFTLILLLSAASYAATINTTMTVDSTVALAGTSISVNGTATLTNIGNGAFTATAGLTNVDSSGNASVNFKIALAGGDLNGTVKIPASSLLAAGNVTGSATITGGTNTYAGATGSFPSLTGTTTGSVTSSITLHFSGAGTVVTGGTGGPPTTNNPTITDVLDAGSYTKSIAQGSIFVVKGTNLSASGFSQFQFPLPTTSGGVKITFTPVSGGAGTDAYLIYLFNQNGVNQLAAVLPSTVAAGNYSVTVTNNGTASANFAATVVARKPGIITQDSTGAGLAVIQNFVSQTQLDIDRFTTGSIGGFTISPAKPNQILILWMTGLGPVTGGDNTASPGLDLRTAADIKVIVGGKTITPLYAGRAPGLAGADQVNFQLPADTPTGCTVELHVTVNGASSNSTFVSIAPNAGASACVSPSFNLSQLQKFDQGGSITSGVFSMTSIAFTLPQVGNVKQNSIAGGFSKYTGFQLAGAEGSNPVSSTANGCVVTHTTTQNSSVVATGTGTVLDAGTVTLTGPAGSNLTTPVTIPKDATGAYFLSLGTEGLGIQLPGSVNATLVAGTYRLHGAGGKDVGQFDASVTLGAPLSITGGLPPTVNRGGGLRLAWTGGNSTDIVIVSGTSGTTTGTGVNATFDGAAFTCITTAGLGGITVGADILTQLPASQTGSLAVFSTVNPTVGNNGVFTAPLVAGGNVDTSLFLSLLGSASTPTYQ